jgi:hypothetical protein
MASAKYTPRSRKVGKPISTPAAAPASVATGMSAQGERSKWICPSAVV